MGSVGATGATGNLVGNLIPIVIDVNFTKKTQLMKEWKRKCGIQALISGKSSSYYALMDLLFGIPPIIMVSAIGIIEGYNGVDKDPSSYFLAKLILAPLAALFKAIHFQCEFSTLAKDFKRAYNDYISIKRDIDLYETMELTEDDLLSRIVDIKKKIEIIKKSSPIAPWIVNRQFDETNELAQMSELANELE